MDLEFLEPLRKTTKASDRLETSNTKLTARRGYSRRVGSSKRVTTLDSRTREVVVGVMTSVVGGGGVAVGEGMQMFSVNIVTVVEKDRNKGQQQSESKTRGHLLRPVNRDLDSVMTSKI